MAKVKMRNSLKVYFIIIFSTSCYDNVYSGNVISRCKDRCEVVKHQVTEAEELVCGATCRVEQCKHGCGVWKDAMLLGCPVACNGTASLQHKMQYCVQGCSYALDIYAQDIRGVYRNMTSSSLKPVVGGVNSSSVILKWEAQQIAGLNYYVQKKYTPLSLDKRRRAAWPGGWEYHRSAKWTSNQTLLIWGLRPYVQYKFRLEVVISATHTVMLPESVPVATKEFGLPPEAPKVTRVAPSSTSIHIMWDAPVFTNGRLHVYQLTLRKMLKYEYPKIKEVPASKQPLSTVFTLLEANTTYNLSIAARNLKGAGPSASLMVSTQPLQSAPGVPAHLIVGSDNTILKLNLASLYDSPVTLYTGRNTSAKIKGVALHYRKNLMIFSDSTGRIRSRHVNGSYSESKVLCMRDKPTTLSIDWLHDKLYIMERARISQCDLDCGRCISVLHGFTLRPGHLVADPGDGYLFWSQSGQHQGLYRMDLADVGKSVTDPSKYLIVRNNSLYGFMVDFPNYRLYYPDYQEKVMISAYLDGSDEQRMVRKVARSQWHHVESLVYHQGLFYWTSGTKVYQETYNPQQKKYFHNEMWQWHSNGGSPVYNGLSLWHPVSQPIPVPLSAPHQVCALFTSNSASVSWKPPQLELGQGAWHEWQYEIEIVGKQGTKRQRSIDKTSSRVLDLKASSQYHIRVRGYSTQGPGPWSQTFTGSTLQAGPVAPKLLYADRTRIFSSRIDGSENKWILSTNLSLGKIVDVDAYDDLIMWTQHRGAVFIKYYNRPPFHLGHIKHAVAVAYDWLAQKVYWSNHKQNTIMRSAVNGSHMEMIYYSMAQDLVLDSYNAFLYWTTDHSLESIRLNGQGHQVLQSLELFSGIYTMGLTVNVDSGHLYWVVKAVNKATLYRTRLLEGEGGKAVVEQMGVLHSVALRPVLHYFSNHFVFLDSNNKPVITDWGLYRATIDVGEVKVQTLTVYHPSLYKVPAGLNQTSIQVLPEPVQPASVRITGFWDNFTLLWQPSSVNHGKVFYELSLQYETGQTVVESSLSEPRHQVENIKPYTQVNVSVRAYTYWGSARATQVILRTPMSVPSSPYRPRGFVTYTRKPLSKAYKVRLEFRWNRPRQPNGKIQAYNVYQSDSLAGPWQKKHMYMRGHVTVDPAKVNHVYYFKVDACTVIGCSNATAPVHINTADEKPVPRLLMTTGKAIKVNFVDDHLTLNIINASASSLTFIAQEHVYYWLEANKIMELDTGQKRQVASLKGEGLSLAVDWISRTLYWTARVSGEEYYAVYQYKMDQNDGWGKKIITADGRLDKVAVDPYDKTLYWTETLPGSGTQVMAANIDKPDMVRKVFNRANGTGDKRQRREIDASCTCVSLSLGPTFVIDHSDRDNLQMFVVEDISGNIWAADMNGCMCRLVVNASRPGIRGLPPDSLTVDESRVFWSSASSRIIASADKFTGKILEVQTLKEPPVNIVAFGEHLQPMPDPSCLKVVGQYNNVSMERGKTNQSLTLALWPWQPPALPQCVNISSPTVKYTLHYRRIRSYDRKDCGSPGVHCDTQSTYQLESTLRGLEPFSLYQVQVSVSNFFTETYGPGQDAGSLGPSAIFRTQEGVPSRARNVTAIPETPTQVMVQWRLPAHPHGHPPDLYYQIRAKAVASSGQAVHSQESGMRAGSKVCNFTRAERVNPDQMIHPEKVLCRLKVVKLASKQTYQFTVSTYEKTRTYSSVTDPIVATTYQYPGPITLMQATNHNITIKWVSPSDDGVYRHNIEYTPSQANDWSPMRVETTRNATVYINSLHDLPPNKEYAFRVNVIYKSFETFTWPKGNEKPYRFSTLVAVPSRPDMPHIIQTKGGAYKVTWDVPENGGTAVDHYSLVYRTPDNFNWTQAYNGTGTQWVVEGLVGGKAYSFRVAAKNTEGWSPYSANTSFLIIKTIEPGTYKQDQLTIVLGSTLSVIIIIIAACCIVLAIVYRQRSEHKGIPAELVAGLNRHSPDLELATLRELPRNHIQAANALYAINIIPTDEDIAALPHYRRDQLTLTKFLGSGAFGEVFEGLARNILSEDSGETNVAVKTLRKGATDTEKEEFLKEALLMSNFKHEHILRLLGVCLDNDPQFIILELMEGGDLLSYLRASRPSSQVEARLSLPDMVGICLDVALGCQYLEDMHFVHRDLAARNCLVSTADNRVRSVKIGDFGLARDIYNNDYYRKEGEGLLPVRWMSPESLVDGVFTTQSDVWAFGILMWETLTFGQQPYPARTNIEVLHFVRSGGRLDRPNNCPDDLYHLMLKCWAFTPDDRPSFHFIAEQLESFKSRSADPNSDFAARWSYGNADDGGIDNPAYDGREVDMDSDSLLSPAELAALKQQSGLGGSVKLSPGSKKKRLQKLLGSSSTEEMSSDQQCSLMTTGQPPAADSSTSGGMMPRRGSTDSLDSLGYMRPLKSPPANYLEILPDPDSVSAPPRINIQKHKPKNASTRNKENSGQKTPPGGHQNQLNYAHVGGTSSQCDMDTDNSAVMLPPAKTSSPKSSNKKTPQSECTGELNYAHLGASNNQCDMDTDNSAVMLPPAKSSSPKTSTRPSESDYADIIRVSDCDRVDNKQQRPVRPSDRNNGGARTKWPPTNRKSNSNRNESVNYSPLANLSPVNCNVDTNSKPVTPHSVNPSPSQTSYASVSPRPTLNGHAPGHSTSHSSPNTSLSSQQPGQPSGSTLVPQSTDKGLAKGTRSTPTNGLTVQGWPDFGDSRV